MAYVGSTAASSVSNPPVKIATGIMASYVHSASSIMSTAIPGTKQGGSLWFYSSTNVSTKVTAANFFTDGKALGMRAGDVVMYSYYSTAGSSMTLNLAPVKSVSTSGASLSKSGTIDSTAA